MNRKGLWVVIDGIDAVGKTTQVGLIADQSSIDNIPIVLLPEFSNSAIGETIRRILTTQRFYSLDFSKTTPLADTVHLLSDMLFSYEKVTVPEITKGSIVLSDRGPLSFFGYQSVRVAKRSARGLSLSSAAEWVGKLVEHSYLLPDLTIVLDIPNSELNRRVVLRGENELEESELCFLNEVNSLMKKNTNLFSKKSVIIDGIRSAKETSDLIITEIRSLLKLIT